MNSNSYCFEAFLLGTLIFFGLSNVDIKVTINVTDKPVLNNVERAEGVHNIERPVH